MHTHTHEKEITHWKFTLLSIDAWREPEGWTWNNWYKCEDVWIALDCHTPRKLFKALRRWDYLTEESKGKLSLDDDGHNIVIQLKSTGQPLLALCYGEHWKVNGL